MTPSEYTTIKLERPADWLGCSYTEEKQWTRPTSNADLGPSLLYSPTRKDRPAPKKIEGLKSIKENPFFKNFSLH